MDFVDICGWVGAVVLLLGFGLSMRKIIGPQSFAYVILNLTGSILLIINAFMIEAYPFLIVNIFWALISTHQLVKMFSKE
jgi:membrane-bound ClpP family serine protease